MYCKSTHLSKALLKIKLAVLKRTILFLSVKNNLIIQRTFSNYKEQNSMDVKRSSWKQMPTKNLYF